MSTYKIWKKSVNQICSWSRAHTIMWNSGHGGGGGGVTLLKSNCLLRAKYLLGDTIDWGDIFPLNFVTIVKFIYIHVPQKKRSKSSGVKNFHLLFLYQVQTKLDLEFKQVITSTEPLPLWIYLTSTLGGVAILCIFVIILYAVRAHRCYKSYTDYCASIISVLS